MSTYEISKSSLLSLKAEILRKQQELAKAKVDNEVKVRILKKNTPLEIKNKGVEARIRSDECEEEEDLLKQSRSVLEYKAELYKKLSSGSLTDEERKNGKRFLVRFDKKNKSKVSDLPPSGSEDEDKALDSDNDYYNSDDDINIKDPGEKFVDYVDCFGRTRRCLQKDLEYLKSNDEELRKIVEEKKKQNEQALVDGDDCNKEIPQNNDDSVIEREKEGSTISPEESELLSSDMRREMLRKKWEAEEEELRNKSDIHYQDILFSEARTHGVGYYSFSKDEEERLKQQQALKKLREDTEEKQKKAQELKLSREKLLAARIKAARNRKRARMGLPPEEDEPEPPQEPKPSEEEVKKQEEIKLKEQMREQILEEARRNHLRPWDIGKEGVKEHYVMTQEEWVDKKREERPEAFAPPTSERRDFRSCNKKIEVEDTDKSLKFSSKNTDRKKRPVRTKLACLNPYKSEIGNDKGLFKDKKDQQTTINKYELSGRVPLYEEIPQNKLVDPTPIVDLTDPQDLEFDDRLLGDYDKIMQDINKVDCEGSERGKGVEIAPPPTMEYYGPSQNKIPRNSAQLDIFEDSIEAGLKFLRTKVEQKEKSSKHPREMFLL